MNLQELKTDELKNINGGLLGIGDDSSSLTGILEGYLNISHTDEDGDTESVGIGFGAGSMFGSMFD